MKRAMILAILLTIAGCDQPEKVPYKFLRTEDGVNYYVYCTDKNCSLIPESEVPEQYRVSK